MKPSAGYPPGERRIRRIQRLAEVRNNVQRLLSGTEEEKPIIELPSLSSDDEDF